MKYLEEGTLLSNIQNRYNNDSCQPKNLKLSSNRIDSSARISSQKLSKSYILPKENTLKNSIEKPLKSPRRLECTNAAANRLYQLHVQKNNNNKAGGNNKTNSKANNNAYLLNELASVYNGFTHKFTNENSSIRAYKIIGHTTLSFASIISMKNRPLLDRKVINESNLRRKKELQQRQNKAQEQKKKRNEQLKSQTTQPEKIIPPAIDTVHTSNPNQTNASQNVDHEVKVEIIRTLSVSEAGRLSSESLQSLQSVDYLKIEDIINDYINMPQMPETPIRFESNQDNLNSLNHLYDAFTYFHNDSLKQYIAWIPLNNKKGCLSASSLLSKKHAPIVFKKTITHPKRVSSLYANLIHNDKNTNNNNTQNTIKKPTEPVPNEPSITTNKEEAVQKPTPQINTNTKPSNNKSNNTQKTPASSKVNTAKSLHSQVVNDLINNKSPKKAEQKSSNKTPNTKPAESKKINPQEKKTESKPQPQESKNESKPKVKSLESKPKSKPKAEKKSKPKNKEQEMKIVPKQQGNTTEKNSNNKHSRIPVLPNTTIDINNIKLGEYKKNTVIPYQKSNGKYSMIPTLGKFEFPFYHMYDAFETFGKGLLRAPRAWRQLKKNVVSIASIYAFDNRP